MANTAKKTKPSAGQVEAAHELHKDLPDGGPLPGEEHDPQRLPNADELFNTHTVASSMDEQVFVRMEHIDQVFVGQFIRLVQVNGQDKDRVKYPGFIFAEYPSGRLRVLPPNWSIGEEVAKQERKDPEWFKKHLVRLTLVDILAKKDGSTVKLYRYDYTPTPAGFRPASNDLEG